MTPLLLIGGAVGIFLYALSQSTDNADSETLNTVGDFTGNTDTILMTAPDRRSLLQALGMGIATGEGYFQTGTLPNRQNNPGDVKVGGVLATFQPDTFDNPLPNGGWAALYHQLNLNLNGSSHVYDLGMSLRQMCATWTGLTDNGSGATPELDNYVACVVQSLNSNNFPATEDTTIGALARGDFSS